MPEWASLASSPPTARRIFLLRHAARLSDIPVGSTASQVSTMTRPRHQRAFRPHTVISPIFEPLARQMLSGLTSDQMRHRNLFRTPLLRSAMVPLVHSSYARPF